MLRDETCLDDVRNAARRSLSYVEGMTRAEFLADDKTKAAVVRELEIMGEGASRVSLAFRDAHPEVPWRLLIQLRNFYIHVYDAIEYGRVWATLTRRVAEIQTAISALLPQE
ncbi:MAG TPA: HepT-like ribonuclease domain-containing protein [Armatimonadota bacterium]|nr:HepT-like ribonuclease domain-containing protein [Armatimonadota bacterium]